MLLFLLPIGILATGCNQDGEKGEKPILNVTIEKVALSSSHSAVRYVGQVEEDECTALSFKLSGTLLRINVEEGELVKAGQVIAEIDDATMVNALNSAKAAYDQAKDNYERMKNLYQRKSLPESQWVDAQSRMQQAEAAYNNACENLSFCRITAPFSGVIGDCPGKLGETVMPGQPVAMLLSIKRVKVKVAVPEKEIGGIATNSECEVSVAALKGASFKSKRITKNVSSDLSTHTYDIWIHLDNPESRLLPGMICDVAFENDGEQAITVPITAVYDTQGEKKYVWVAVDGKAKQVAIKTGETYGNRIAVIDGLQTGDMIITSGGQKLSVGSAVKY